MSKRNSIMQPITHTTTNTQIAVCAAALYYRDGAPPALCERLITTCLHIDSLPDDDEALTQQALIQAHETGPSSFRVEPNSQNRWSSSSPVGMWAGCL